MKQTKDEKKLSTNKAFENYSECFVDVKMDKNNGLEVEEKRCYVNDTEQNNEMETKPSTLAYVYQVRTI